MKLKLELMDGTTEYIEHDFIRNVVSQEQIQVIGHGDYYNYSDLLLAELDGEVIYKYDCFKIDDDLDKIFEIIERISVNLNNKSEEQKEKFDEIIRKAIQKRIKEKNWFERVMKLLFKIELGCPILILNENELEVYKLFYVDGLTTDNIAGKLKIEIREVKKTLSDINRRFNKKASMIKEHIGGSKS